MTKNPDGTVTLTAEEAAQYLNLRIRRFLDAKTPNSRSGESTEGTWRAWLRNCLIAVVNEGEDFSGKRPLGNSDWFGDLDDALKEYALTIEDVIWSVFAE